MQSEFRLTIKEEKVFKEICKNRNATLVICYPHPNEEHHVTATFGEREENSLALIYGEVLRQIKNNGLFK